MSWIDNKIKEEAQRDPNFMTWFDKEKVNLDMAVTITDFRVHLGLTQNEFAERVGKKLSVITRIESGELIPSLKLINEIVHAVQKKNS